MFIKKLKGVFEPLFSTHTHERFDPPKKLTLQRWYNLQEGDIVRSGETDNATDRAIIDVRPAEGGDRTVAITLPAVHGDGVVTYRTNSRYRFKLIAKRQ